MKRLILLFLLGSHLPGYCQSPVKSYKVTPVKVAVTKEEMLKKFQLAPLTFRPVGTNQTLNIYCSCTPLAVTSIKLEAERLNPDLVKLTWKTRGEINTTGFDIERSFNDSRSFIKVGFAFPRNSTSDEKEYIANDANNYDGSSFYRIKEIDIDGKFTYSNIAHVYGNLQNEMIDVYPNPAHDLLQIQVVTNKNSSATMSYLDAAGKTVISQALSFNKGTNNSTVNISLLASGMYIIKVSRPGEKDLVGKFVKY